MAERPLTWGERIFWVAVLAAILMALAIPATDPPMKYESNNYRVTR